jgi:serine/threonine protein kinase/tetratricopeptide (TPR) repeat protein
MPEPSRVQELLEAALDADRTPEDVCADTPELLPAVRQRWERCRRLRAQLDGLFPPSGSSIAAAAPMRGRSSELPQVPGYAVEAILGRGGMGVVFRARHLQLNRTVAIKMPLSGAYLSRSEHVRFMREARAIAGLRHPHMVQIHDVGEFDGRPFYTMEYVEGGNLAERLAGAPQPAAQAANLVATLAAAVESAHQGGIIHRDLKPGNVLLTAEGAPKISDFGLARRVEDVDALTLTGARLGTPSYMAPEQLGGRPAATGPATDIYALGAILYEMLTGRPPFRGESTTETERQLLAHDPVPPSRLNPRIPRDLETICLKCLQKVPARRYATAAALADDLGRFRRGEPIEARPIGTLERSAKWVRRHPSQVAVAAGILTAAIALGGSGLWLISQRAAVAQAADNDLREAARLQRHSSWGEAMAALDRARTRLENHRFPDLRGRLDQGDRDQQLASRLDAICLGRVVAAKDHPASPLNNAQADAAYDATFRAAGLGTVGADPARVAARVAASNAREALVVALDDWAVCTPDPRRRDWLLGVARRADPDPTGWRDRARDPDRWLDADFIDGLARTAFAADPPVPLLVTVGERLQDSGRDPIPFLSRVQQEHPGDFWANFTLGDALWRRDSFDDAIRYYQAALAVRPKSPVAHGNLGMALAAVGRANEAIAHFRQAIELDPDFAHGHYSLGLALKGQGLLAEALVHLLRAQQLDPSSPNTPYNIGLALNGLGRPSDAIDPFRTALRLAPEDVNARYNLGLSLRAVGRPGDAATEFTRAIGRAPGMADAHYNLGLALKDLGRPTEAAGQFRETVRVDAKYAAAYGALGDLLLAGGDRAAAAEPLRRCLALLGPTDADRPRYAGLLQQCDPAAAAGRAPPSTAPSPEALYSAGLALNGAGRPVEAIEQFRSALRLTPGDADVHYNLGLALRAAGRPREAAAEFGIAIRQQPGMADAHYNLGLALRELGRPEDAIGQFEQTVRINPQYASALGALGDLLLAAGNPFAAREPLRRCAALLPPNDADRPRYATLLRQCDLAVALGRQPPATGPAARPAAPPQSAP